MKLETPQGWELGQLSEVAFVEWGNTSITKKSYVSSGFTAYSASGSDGFLPAGEWSGEGVVLSAIGAKCGKCFMANGQWTAIKNTIVIQPLDRICENSFLFYFLNDQRRWELSGSGQPFITLKTARGNLIPIPPLNEQHRIVAKIEELFSELEKGVESLKAAKVQLAVYRQSVLKAAFEGRLTEEWRKEYADKLESADKLLTRIKIERETRYAAQLTEWQQAVESWETVGKPGKKPTKPKKPQELPPLTPEELADLPELPEGWGWTKVDFIADKVTDGEHITPRRVDKGFYLLSARNIQDGFLALDNVDFIPDDEYERIRKRCDPEEGDILVSCSGSVGRVCRVPKNIACVMVRSVALIKFQMLKESSKFFELLLQSPLLQKQIEKGKKATAQANLFLGPIKDLRVIACSQLEQHQIVQEIESRFSVVEKMEQTIEESLQKSEALRQSILKRAFEGKLVPQDPSDEPASELLARIRAERAKVPATGRKKKEAA